LAFVDGTSGTNSAPHSIDLLEQGEEIEYEIIQPVILFDPFQSRVSRFVESELSDAESNRVVNL
jgi:hypothetical protein